MTSAPEFRGRGKGERLEARVSAEQKRLFEQAAAIQGQTLSDFLLTSARQAAEQAIRNHQVIELSQRDAEALMASLLAENEAGPRLREAAQRYRSRTGSP